MRILHCTESLDPAAGGPARSVPQLALAQARLGHEVALWSPNPGPQSLPDLDSQEVALGRFHGPFREVLCRLGAVDIVHDHGVWLPFHKQVAKECAKLRICRVVSPRGMLEPWALNHKKWKKKLAWWLYQRRDLESAAALHATAESEAAQFRRLGLRHPILVSPNGVDVRDATPMPHSAPRGFRTALFLSRIHPKKGLPLLVEAWAKIRPEGWRMRVVGSDENGHRREVESLVAKAGLADTWEFENALEGEAKWASYRAADLFILPTYSENFGIVVAEALACGIPALTTTGAPWQGLQEHRCGWWVAPTAEAIAAALADATGLTTTQRAEMGARGRAWVQRDFTWPPIARAMVEFYDELARGTSGTRDKG